MAAGGAGEPGAAPEPAPGTCRSTTCTGEQLLLLLRLLLLLLLLLFEPPRTRCHRGAGSASELALASALQSTTETTSCGRRRARNELRFSCRVRLLSSSSSLGDGT